MNDAVIYSNYIRENFPVNDRSLCRRKPIYGVGINDADYVTRPVIDGKTLTCPAYSSWKNMIMRAYSKENHARQPTYKGVTVCVEWLMFSNFRGWWVKNYKDGYHLDKDILGVKDKIYSPDTCIYVPRWVNSFILDSAAKRGKYKIGVCWSKAAEKFRAYCKNPKTDVCEHLGLFETEIDAYHAWLNYKLTSITELKIELDSIDLRLYPNILSIVKSL